MHPTSILAATALLTFLIFRLSNWTEERARADLRRILETKVRRTLLHRLHQASLEALDFFPHGQWLEQTLREITAFELLVWRELPRFPGALATLLALCFLNPFLMGTWGVVIDAILALALWPQIFLISKRAVHEIEIGKIQAEKAELLSESLRGLKTMRCHGAEAYLQRRFDERSQRISNREMVLMRRIRNLDWLRATGNGAAWLIATGVIGSLYQQRSMDTPSALAGLLSATLIAMQWRNLSLSLPAWHQLSLTARRILNLASIRSEASRAQSIVSDEIGTDQVLVMRGLSIVKGGTAFGPLDLKLERGQIVAITGSVGIGKSLLLDVASGLRSAASGQLRVEDTCNRVLWSSGHQQPWLPAHSIALVEQSPFLFLGSLRENLTFGNSQRLSDTLLWECLERVGLYQWVRGLGGLDASLIADGKPYGKGVRYRIALGRAFLLNRAFLMLDEPFAPHDDATIAWICETLDQEKKRAGILITTRSLPRFLNADYMVPMESWMKALKPKPSSAIAYR